MRSTPPPENIDCASLLACLASSPVGRPPDSADSHVGCRITMSVTQRRYSAATGSLGGRGGADPSYMRKTSEMQIAPPPPG